MLVADPLDVVLAEPVGQHRGALEGLHGHRPGAQPLLEVVAGGDRPGGPGGRDEGRGAGTGPRRRDVPEHALQGGAREHVVGDVVPELAELVEDHGVRLAVQLRAAVVDLLDVALGARRPDDVGRVRDPALEPLEPLPAHPGRQDRDAPAAHDPRDRHAAPAVVARGGPDGPLGGGIELPGHDPRREAPVGGDDLVRPDHREPVTQGDHDRRRDAGQLRGQHHVFRDVHAPGPARVVEPVRPEQVERVGGAGVDGLEAVPHVRGDQVGFGQLGERRQGDAERPAAIGRAVADVAVDDVAFEPQTAHVLLLSRHMDWCPVSGHSRDRDTRHGQIPRVMPTFRQPYRPD